MKKFIEYTLNDASKFSIFKMYNYYKLGETTFLAAFYLVFGLYFFEFTLHQDKYIDEGCVALKYWAHLYSIFA